MKKEKKYIKQNFSQSNLGESFNRNNIDWSFYAFTTFPNVSLFLFIYCHPYWNYRVCYNKSFSRLDNVRDTN